MLPAKLTIPESLQKRWQEMASVDLRSLAFMRIALAVVLLCDLGTRAFCLQAHYTDNGLLPVELMHKISWDKWYFSFHAWSGNFYWESFLFILAAIFALMMLLGYKTRFAIIASWILLVSLQNRNQFLLNGGDQLFRMGLFWSMFLPLGARFSVDSIKNKFQDFQPDKYISVAGFALLMQIFFMYFFAGYSKLDGVWGDGKAISNSLFMTDLLGKFGMMLNAMPEYILRTLDYYIYISQLVLPFFLFVPFRNRFFRNISLGNFVLFHLMIILLFNIGIFPWVALAVLLGLFPFSFYGRIGNYISDIFSQKVSSESENLTKENILFSKKVLNPAALFFLLYITWWNFYSYDLIRMSRVFKPIGMILRIDQKWDMFRTSSMQQAVLVSAVAHRVDNSAFDINKEYWKTFRWRNYMYYMPYFPREEFRENFCKFVCTDWNAKHDELSKIQSVNLMMKEFKFYEDSRIDTTEKVLKACDCTIYSEKY